MLTRTTPLLILASVLILVSCGSKEEADQAAKNAPKPADIIAGLEQAFKFATEEYRPGQGV